MLHVISRIRNFYIEGHYNLDEYLFGVKMKHEFATHIGNVALGDLIIGILSNVAMDCFVSQVLFDAFKVDQCL